MDTDPLLDRATVMHRLGLSRRGLRHAITKAEVVRVSRGWYLPSAGPVDPARVQQAHPGQPELSAVAQAALRATGRPAAVAHVHAAVAWGLPCPRQGPGDVRLTSADGCASAWTGVRLDIAALAEDDLSADVHGRRLTSAPRTVVDCARSLPTPDALAIADAALHAKLLTRADLEACLSRMQRWPGAAAARLVIELADGRRESPLESWSAWAFHHEGLPLPQWQVVVTDPDLDRRYRLDCLWEGGLAGEADGRSKALLRAAERRGAPADVLARMLAEERHREGRLRALGFDIIRWSARDILDPAARARLCRLITAHLERSA